MYCLPIFLCAMIVGFGGVVFGLVERCPSGWTYFMPTAKCFLIVRNKTFNDANAFCNTIDGTLAIIHRDTENIFLTTLTNPGSLLYNAQLTNPKQLYIGLSDPSKTRKFQWLDGSPLNYTNWQPKQPDNLTGNQYCGTLVSSDGTGQIYTNWTAGKWDDVDCSLPYDGICQKAASN